jgi:hypothetical protein
MMDIEREIAMSYDDGYTDPVHENVYDVSPGEKNLPKV